MHFGTAHIFLDPSLAIVVICCKYYFLQEAKYDAPKYFRALVKKNLVDQMVLPAINVKDEVMVVPWKGSKVIVTDVARSLGPSFGREGGNLH